MAAVDRAEADPAVDFLDGTIFSPTEMVVVLGSYAALPVSAQLQTGVAKPYYRMVRKGYRNKWFTHHRYVYRWDLDGYYSFMQQYPVLNSSLLRQALLHEDLQRSSVLRALGRCENAKGQVMAQVGDFMLPRNRSAEFYKWYAKDVGLFPLYMCPITQRDPSPFVPQANKAIDFGVGYGVVNNQDPTLLRRCMLKAYALDGDILKYSPMYTSAEEFWKFYSPDLRAEYETARRKHGAERLRSVAAKLVTPS